MPTFNPFDTKSVGQHYSYPYTTGQYGKPRQDAGNLIDDTFEPKLLSPQEYDLSTVNMLAFAKKTKNGQSVSWAFNVEALEQPRRFQVIQPASQRAYDILDRAIKNAPQVLAPVVVDEEALKSAIRGLINSSQVKPEAVQTIAEALGNEQITKEYWHTLFNGQGAKTAISQKIYSPQMVRLITLRAMVIPETLPEFLSWLNVKGGKKPDENQTVSLEFQSASAISDLFPKDRLADGIKFILPKLLQEEIALEAVYWLLMIKGSAWFACRKEFTNDVKADLQVIADSFKPLEPQANQANNKNSSQQRTELSTEDFKCEYKIWEKLINNWKSIQEHKIYLTDYKLLAELFARLKAYSLSAYFYQVSNGIVPNNIFRKVVEQNSLSLDSVSIPFLDLTLKRKLTLFESFTTFLTQEFIVPIQLVIPISLVTFVIGLFVGSKYLFQQSSSNEVAFQKESPANSSSNNNQPISKESTHDNQQNRAVEFQVPNLPTKVKTKAIDNENFEKTRKAINQIVEQIHEQRPDINKDEIINEIKNVLAVPNLNYSATENNGEERAKLATAIYQYQKEEFGEKAAFGYMISGQQTTKSLQKQVEENFVLKYR